MKYLPSSLERYLTVADQIAISASAFATSAAVVKISSVDQLGLYTALLTVATLIQTGFGSIVSGQLLLFISGKNPRFASVYFKLSYQIWPVFTLCLSLLTFITVYILGFLGVIIDSKLVILALLFVVGITSFEQNRRYFYATSDFKRSFLFTMIFLILHAFISCVLFWKTNQFTAKYAFTSFGIAYLVVSLANPYILKIVLTDHAEKRLGAFRVFKKFLMQGKFAFLGLFTAWVQNQSMPIFYWLYSVRLRQDFLP